MFRSSCLTQLPVRTLAIRGEALPPPDSSDDELMVPEAEIVPYEDAQVVASGGAAGSSYQVRPAEPTKLQAWIMSVHDDPETKNIKLKYGLRRLKF